MITLEQVRHQVAIVGRVTDAQTGGSIAGALVTITNAPSPQKTLTAADGHFHFLDLPDGQYTLTTTLPGAGSCYGTAQVTVVVARDAQGNIKMASADMALPSTTVKGQITGQSNAPVVMAQVRVKGSGEQTFSDAHGRYLLNALETGSRTVLVTAQGYQSASQTVQITQPGSVQTLNFALVPSP